VTRIQLQAISSVATCEEQAGIRVSDGTTGFTLKIPNNPATNGFSSPVSADSGTLNLSFPQGDHLVVRAVPGSNDCNPYEINITVQYSINIQ